MRNYYDEVRSTLDNILVPYGLTPSGVKGLWAEDIGFYVSIVELLPKKGEDAVIINTAISFLWEKSKDLNGDLTFDFSNRIKIDGKDCKKDEQNLSIYIDQTINNLAINRKFKDTVYAKNEFFKRCLMGPDVGYWELYDYSFLCFMNSDYDEGIRRYNEFLSLLKCDIYRNGVYIDWVDEFYNHSVNDVLPILINEKESKSYVEKTINNRRLILSRSKVLKPIITNLDHFNHREGNICGMSS